MKRLSAIFIVGILLLSLSSVSAITIPKATDNKILPIQKTRDLLPKTYEKTLTGGNFSGQFAKKNDTGYVILGSLEGTYNDSGTFDGMWNAYDGNISGTMSGWFWSHIFIGQIEYSNNSDWFVGLYNVNTTSNEFVAVSLIFSSPFMIRYAAGTLS